MAGFFQEHLADQEGAGVIGDPIGIEINPFVSRVANRGVGSCDAIEFGVAAEFHREAQALAGELALQRINALIKQCRIGASGSENLLDQGVEIGLLGEAGEGLVGACQGLLPGLCGAISQIWALAGLLQLIGIKPLFQVGGHGQAQAFHVGLDGLIAHLEPQVSG